MASINIRRGSEGPEHDPYAFVEIEFTRTDGVVVVLHGGLAEWCRVYLSDYKPGGGLGRFRRRASGTLLYETDGDDCVDEFYRRTGLTPHQADRYHRRLSCPTKCPKCGSKKRYSADGYPGESFDMCGKCSKIVSSHFNPSEIE